MAPPKAKKRFDPISYKQYYEVDTPLSSSTPLSRAFYESSGKTEKEYEESIRALNYNDNRTALTSGLLTIMMGAMDETTKQPLYTIEDILDPTKLQSERKALYEKVLSAPNDTDKQRELDIALLRGFNRNFNEYMKKVKETMLRGGSFADLTDQNSITQIQMCLDVNDTLAQTTYAKFKERITEIGKSEDYRALYQQIMGNLKPNDNFISILHNSLSSLKPGNYAEAQGLIGSQPFQAESTMMNALCLANLQTKMKETLAADPDADIRTLENNITFIGNGGVIIHDALESVDEDELDEVQIATREQLQPLLEFTAHINEDMLLKFGALSMMSNYALFSGSSLIIDENGGASLPQFHAPSDQELCEAAFRTEFTWNTEEMEVAYNYSDKLFLNGSPEQQAIRNIYEDLMKDFPKGVPTPAQLDALGEKVKKAQERITAIADETDPKNEQKKLREHLKSAKDAFALGFRNFKKVAQTMYEHGLSPLADRETPVNSPEAVDERTKALNDALAEMNRTEATFNPSVEWKLTKESLKRAIEANKAVGVDATPEKLAALDDALQNLQKNANRYVEHKLGQKNAAKGGDLKRLCAVKRLGRLTERELRQTTPVMEKEREAMAEAPYSKAGMARQAQKLGQLLQALKDTRTAGDGSSDKYRDMIAALEAAVNSAVDNRDGITLQGEVSKRRDDPAWRKMFEHTQHLADAYTRISEYMEYKKTNNNGSLRSETRIQLAGEAQSYLAGFESTVNATVAEARNYMAESERGLQAELVNRMEQQKKRSDEMPEQEKQLHDKADACRDTLKNWVEGKLKTAEQNTKPTKEELAEVKEAFFTMYAESRFAVEKNIITNKIQMPPAWRPGTYNSVMNVNKGVGHAVDRIMKGDTVLNDIFEKMTLGDLQNLAQNKAAMKDVVKNRDKQVHANKVKAMNNGHPVSQRSKDTVVKKDNTPQIKTGP